MDRFREIASIPRRPDITGGNEPTAWGPIFGLIGLVLLGLGLVILGMLI